MEEFIFGIATGAILILLFQTFIMPLLLGSLM